MGIKKALGIIPTFLFQTVSGHKNYPLSVWEKLYPLLPGYALFMHRVFHRFILVQGRAFCLNYRETATGTGSTG